MLKLNYYEVARVRCDKCNNVVEFPSLGKDGLIKEVRRFGWSIGKRCLCPSCREIPQSYCQYGSRRGRFVVTEKRASV